MIEIITIFLRAVMVAMALAGVGLTLWISRHRLGETVATYRVITPGIWVQALLALIAVILCAWGLWQIPGMSWGWYKLLTGHDGNANLTPITDLSKSSSLFLRVMPLLFVAALLLVLPDWARSEEQWFRYGITDWPTIWVKSVKFGLMHCIVGIPLAVGLALTVAGLFYARTYRRVALVEGAEAGLEASTVAHLAYNTLVIVPLALFLATQV